jgi:hypothetical protein
MLASKCRAPVPLLIKPRNLVQPGSLCLCVIRQTLPGRLQGAHAAKLVHVQAVESNEESDLEGSALTRICLARQMLLYRRERRTHRRNARCVSRGDSNCFSGASLRSIPADIRRFNARGFQSIFKYERREPGWHRHRIPAETCFAGCETTALHAPCPYGPVAGSSSEDSAAASPGGSATAVDQSNSNPDTAAPGRTWSFCERFDRCGWPANARCSSGNVLADGI